MRYVALLKQLIHNGIVIPDPPEPVGLVLTVRGRAISLTPKQEEMAMAWARKKDTDYVKDDQFAKNFASDFGAALGVSLPLAVEEVDFGPAYALVDREREQKEQLTKEERRALAAERKAAREELKARYGYAIVDGQRVELGTYMTEPSGIFMGRGEHPLRGRWKEGARQSDVTLNLSPDAPPVEGDWNEIVWQPDSMWVARWEDKLAGKLKYIWLSDTAPLKQEREELKFDKAVRLSREIDKVRSRIAEALTDERPRRRMIATACYLIDALCLRVGDEKDPDEADTVGATTLRPEHVAIAEGGAVEFRFLGKDSVEWHKTLQPSEVILGNLHELIVSARPSRQSQDGDGSRDQPQLFPDVTSRDVNAFLSGIVPGLTAKVFRTHHATAAVRDSLEESGVAASDAEYKKWRAASLANLEAAVLCNHTKKETGSWANARRRYLERRAKAQERVERARAKVQDAEQRLATLHDESERKHAETKPEQGAAVRARYRQRITAARQRLAASRQQRQRAQDALGKVNAQYSIAGKKRTWNLGTSLKSYIDPRVYHRWGQQVDYDVLGTYYPSTLRRKFHWVRASEETREPWQGSATVRTCMATDTGAVAALFAAVREEYPEITLPLEPREVEASYLPALEREWCEAIIVLDEEQVLVGFASVGPEWCDEGQEALDVLAVLHPSHASSAAEEALADAVRQRIEAYQVLYPRKRFELRPRDGAWLAARPAVAEALGLRDEQDDVEPTAEPEEVDQELEEGGGAEG